MRSAAVLGLVLAIACERGAGRTARHSTVPELEPRRGGDETFIRVEGQGANEDEAYANATRVLAKELLGDARWLDVVPLDLHDRAADLDAQALPDGGVKVSLSLTHSDAAATLAAFRDTEPNVVAPEPWRETIFAYLAAHTREHACVRQRALFDVECETGTTEDADAALKTLAAAVVLTPTPRGGVPLDANQKPLRAPAVVASWNGAPIASVPLRVEFGERVERSYTGDDGRLELALPASGGWPERVRVGVDAELLLGPRLAAWPTPPVAIRSRKLDFRRWSIVVVDDAGVVVGEGPRDAFVAEMRSVGFGDPKAIPGLGRRVSVRSLSAIVERTAGEVDMLVVVELASAYASRVGGGRVWYEAKGKVRAVNAWKLDELASFALDVTASDVGDDRAELAARTKLCTTAAAKLSALLSDRK